MINSMLIALITIFFYRTIQVIRKGLFRAKVNRLMELSIQRFREQNPEVYKEISQLKERYISERSYSHHMGRSGRDAYDREENIRQDKLVSELEEKLKREVELAYFEHTVRDVFREHGGDEDKLYQALLDSNSGLGYGKGYVVIIDDIDIGFKSVRISELI